jgi:hypothetical protein
MNGKPLKESEVDLMVSMRKHGHSLPEIWRATNRGYGTIYRYTKNVKVLPKFLSALRIKQGGSKKKSETAWKHAREQARSLIGSKLSLLQRLCLLSGLYWGEGTKRELGLINSDPKLIKAFVSCLNDIGVTNEDLKINLRLYNGIDKKAALDFWSEILNVKPDQIGKIEMVHGEKVGKLKFGMCRIRVAKSAQYFKLLISLINEIKEQF